jgi:hypothetical protein
MSYSPLKVANLKKGDRLILTHPSAGYTLGPNNPAVGTKWFCAGTLRDEGKHIVHVKWDTGYSNSYRDYELSKADDQNMVSIW